MTNAKLQSVPSIRRLRFDRHTYERNASEINYGGQNRMVSHQDRRRIA
jgi:hypothetical protein